MSFKDELAGMQRKATNVDHNRYAQELYQKALQAGVEHIKNQIRLQFKQGNQSYTGVVSLQFGEGRSYRAIIPYTNPAVYSWYRITTGTNDSNLFIDKDLFTIQSKQGLTGTTYWAELTVLGQSYVRDIVSLCRREGIELDCYLYAEGSYISEFGNRKQVVYERLSFNEKVKPKCARLNWRLRANYRVR